MGDLQPQAPSGQDSTNQSKIYGHVPPLRAERAAFVGRELPLQTVRKHLMAGRNVCVEGVGGIGKTRLAIEYVRTYVGMYPGGIFWLTHQENLGDQYRRILEQCGREARAPKERLQELVQLSIDEALKQGPVLLVWDNMPAEPIDIGTLIPPTQSLHVLVTSQTKWPRFESVEVQHLNEADATLLLYSLSGGPPPEPLPSEARYVLEAIGGLPLALEILSWDLLEYPESLTNLHQRMQQEEPARVVDEVLEVLRTDYPGMGTNLRGILHTLVHSLEKLPQQHQALLRQLSLLALEPIPVSWGVPKDFDARVFRTLRRRFWLETGPDWSVGRLHSLLASVLRCIHKPTDLDQMLIWLAAVSEHRFLETETWVESARLVPHAKHFLKHYYTSEHIAKLENTRQAEGLLVQCMNYSIVAHNEQDSTFFSQLAHEQEVVLGSDFQIEHADIYSLGEIGHHREALQRAEQLYARYIGTPDEWQACQTLGWLYVETGQFYKARDLLVDVLPLVQECEGEDVEMRRLRQNLQHTLGTALIHIEPREAIAWLAPLAGERSTELGETHLFTLRTLNNLATGYHAVGNFSEGEATMETITTHRRRTIPPHHSDRIASEIWMGRFAAALNKHEDALGWYIAAYEGARTLRAQHKERLANIEAEAQQVVEALPPDSPMKRRWQTLHWYRR